MVLPRVRWAHPGALGSQTVARPLAGAFGKGCVRDWAIDWGQSIGNRCSQALSASSRPGGGGPTLDRLDLRDSPHPRAAPPTLERPTIDWPGRHQPMGNAMPVYWGSLLPIDQGVDRPSTWRLGPTPGTQPTLDHQPTKRVTNRKNNG